MARLEAMHRQLHPGSQAVPGLARQPSLPEVLCSCRSLVSCPALYETASYLSVGDYCFKPLTSLQDIESGAVQALPSRPHLEAMQEELRQAVERNAALASLVAKVRQQHALPIACYTRPCGRILTRSVSAAQADLVEKNKTTLQVEAEELQCENAHMRAEASKMQATLASVSVLEASEAQLRTEVTKLRSEAAAASRLRHEAVALRSDAAAAAQLRQQVQTLQAEAAEAAVLRKEVSSITAIRHHAASPHVCNIFAWPECLNKFVGW